MLILAMCLLMVVAVTPAFAAKGDRVDVGNECNGVLQDCSGNNRYIDKSKDYHYYGGDNDFDFYDFDFDFDDDFFWYGCWEWSNVFEEWQWECN
jgi:hypothetical protein